MINGRKAGNTGGGDSDRKHLTSREVERLIEATKGSRNEARDRCIVAPDVPAWLARVGCLRDQIRPGRHRKPRVACGPVEGRATDDAALTQRRAEGRQRMAERTRSDEAYCTDPPSTCSRKLTAKPLPCPSSLIPTCCATLAASPSADQGADTRLIQDYLGHRNIQHTV
jgi:type 1 fimbriae regulatory protein FimB